MPVMPGVEEFEYLLTQMASEYIAEVAARDLDGIIFPSAQRAHATDNVVLFARSSGVKRWPKAVRKQQLGQDEDGSRFHALYEEVPGEKKIPVEHLIELVREQLQESQEPVLQLLPDRIQVLEIKAVSYVREEREVRTFPLAPLNSALDDEIPF